MPRRSSPSLASAVRWAIVWSALLAVSASSALTADQVLLLVNRTDPDASRVAEHYRTVRGVPEGNVVYFDLPAGEDLPRAVYERDVVPALRAWLQAPEHAGKIGCLLSIYGMPLRIGRRTPDGRGTGAGQSAATRGRPGRRRADDRRRTDQGPGRPGRPDGGGG
ncbi:MAG: hypothetical protein M5U09_22175 [Gammaproteobacteria bacterium]|nr:hypothetical protein [Gammaproteobacteria bacterium]